jgi:hypothetical protein
MVKKNERDAGNALPNPGLAGVLRRGIEESDDRTIINHIKYLENYPFFSILQNKNVQFYDKTIHETDYKGNIPVIEGS